ncbi:MAG TPA: enoyl-CoA hydratase-related protein [Candidatus Dormibacteraeota bacterium]|jgi:2-(1,2-epoxy-1,2-dihydrophenyl)acetyl-CoA isomerase
MRSSADRVTLEVDGGVARLRLARPDAHNAIDPAMVAGLGAAVAAVEEHPGVRCLLLSAAGRSFSAGGDLRHLAGIELIPEELEAMVGAYHVTLSRLAELPVPVVCAVQGGAAGGALGLLWCADVVIAAADLRLASGFAKLGLSGDGGSTWHLPRLVGMRRALELTLEGRVLSAEEALAWGLVGRVVPVEALEAEAEATARRYAAGPTVAYGHIRRLLRTSWSATFEEQLAAERAAIVDCGGTADAREGIEAFAARRAARFEGR